MGRMKSSKSPILSSMPSILSTMSFICEVILDHHYFRVHPSPGEMPIGCGEALYRGDVEGDPFGGPVAMRLGVGGSWPTVGQTRLG